LHLHRCSITGSLFSVSWELHLFCRVGWGWRKGKIEFRTHCVVGQAEVWSFWEVLSIIPWQYFYVRCSLELCRKLMRDVQCDVYRTVHELYCPEFNESLYDVVLQRFHHFHRVVACLFWYSPSSLFIDSTASSLFRIHIKG